MDHPHGHCQSSWSEPAFGWEEEILTLPYTYTNPKSQVAGLIPKSQGEGLVVGHLYLCLLSVLLPVEMYILTHPLTGT